MSAALAEVPGDRPSAAVVMVTPDIASRWIARNGKNRNIRRAIVAAYARDMTGGRWRLTGEAVKFDHFGNLIDGQHRLLAVIQSGATVPLLVVRGLAPDAQDVMDSGIKRAAADALHLGGHRNASLLAATARLGILLDAKASSEGGAVTHSEIARWVDNNPDAAEVVPRAAEISRSVDMAPSVIAYTWLMFARIDPQSADRFWEGIANSSTAGISDPRSTLIKRLQTARRQRERLARPVQVSLVVRTWNAWRKGTALRQLKARTPTGKDGGAMNIPIPKPH